MPCGDYTARGSLLSYKSLFCYPTYAPVAVLEGFGEVVGFKDVGLLRLVMVWAILRTRWKVRAVRWRLCTAELFGLYGCYLGISDKFSHSESFLPLAKQL